MRKLFIALAVLVSTPASAEKWVTCHVKQVMHTRLGILINCAEVVPDKILTGTVDNVDWSAPDASGFPSQNGVPPVQTKGEVMAGFQAIALEAFRSQKALRVSFGEGMRPGGLYDCLNTNCRLARAWAIVQ